LLQLVSQRMQLMRRVVRQRVPFKYTMVRR